MVIVWFANKLLLVQLMGRSSIRLYMETACAHCGWRGQHGTAVTAGTASKWCCHQCCNCQLQSSFLQLRSLTSAAVNSTAVNAAVETLSMLITVQSLTACCYCLHYINSITWSRPVNRALWQQFYLLFTSHDTVIIGVDSKLLSLGRPSRRLHRCNAFTRYFYFSCNAVIYLRIL